MEGGGFIVEPVAEGEIVTGNRARSDPQPSTRSVTSPGHERVALQGSGCSKCSSLTFSEEFSKSFGVLLCNQCRRSESLISKVRARALHHMPCDHRIHALIN